MDMLFVDYKFMVPPGGGAIIMDKELTMEQLSALVKVISILSQKETDGSVMFLKEDVAYSSVRQSNVVDENQTGLDI